MYVKTSTTYGCQLYLRPKVLENRLSLRWKSKTWLMNCQWRWVTIEKLKSSASVGVLTIDRIIKDNNQMKNYDQQHIAWVGTGFENRLSNGGRSLRNSTDWPTKPSVLLDKLKIICDAKTKVTSRNRIRVGFDSLPNTNEFHTLSLVDNN